MTPQETHAAVVSLLQQQGLPMTTANLNRGMMALAQNDMSTDNATLPTVNAQMDRTMGVSTPQRGAAMPLPTPPIPPMRSPQTVAANEQALSTPGQVLTIMPPDDPVMPDGSASSMTAGKPVTMPREPGYITSGINAAVRYANDKLTPTAQEPFTYASMMESIRNGRVPIPNPDMPVVMFGTGPAAGAHNAYPAMQQFMRQRTLDAMRQNPARPPSNMLNQAGEGFEEALAARAQAGQRSTYNGEGVDNFIKGGNVQTPSASAPASSVKTNTPTWRGESDPSTPMGTRNTATPQTTQSNTATPRSGGSVDTAGAGAAIKQSLTKRQQMAASKSTRKSKD